MKALHTSGLVTSFALVLGACESKPVDQLPGASSASAPPTTTATATTTATTTPPPTTAKSPASTGKVDPFETEILAVLRRWNDALAKRDAAALDKLYAKSVRFHTVELTHENVVKTKVGIVAKAKDYTQSMSAIEIDVRKKDRPQASFNKKWTQDGTEAAGRSLLVFTNEDGRWVVREESDAGSDPRRARAAANQDSCEFSILQLVSSTPEAIRLLNGPKDPAHGHYTNGTRIGGGPPDQPTYSIAVHENHQDYVATLGWFDVDPKTATVKLGDTPQPTNSGIAEKVRNACR